MTVRWSGVIAGVMGLRRVFIFLLPCLTLPLRWVTQNYRNINEKIVVSVKVYFYVAYISIIKLRSITYERMMFLVTRMMIAIYLLSAFASTGQCVWYDKCGINPDFSAPSKFWCSWCLWIYHNLFFVCLRWYWWSFVMIMILQTSDSTANTRAPQNLQLTISFKFFNRFALTLSKR